MAKSAMSLCGKSSRSQPTFLTWSCQANARCPLPRHFFFLGNHESAQNFSHYKHRFTMPHTDHNLFYRCVTLVILFLVLGV